MSIHLDPTRPIYIQIMEEVKKRTVRGQYKPGKRLPSVRDLAKEMEVNPNTVARVYMELDREGFIFTKRGEGSFVTDESGRVESERNRLADDAMERFIREIGDLKLDNGHRRELLDMINKEFYIRQDKEKGSSQNRERGG